jgi:hypothetical protein
MWRAAAGDPYCLEKNPDEILMFARFAERGLSLPASDFFQGLVGYYGIEYLNLNPNGIFHTVVWGSSLSGDAATQCQQPTSTFLRSLSGDPASLDLVPEVLSGDAATQCQQPTSSRRSGNPYEEDAAEQYLYYKLIDSNQD